jgi:D-aminoacyl-tRNA deacylase
VYWGARRSVKEQFRTVEVGYCRSTIAPPNPNRSPPPRSTFLAVEPSGEADALGNFDLQAEGTTGKLASMRAVLQRVGRAQVFVNGEVIAKIGRGILVLLAVGGSDSSPDADYLAEKIAGVRIFEDANGKMSLAPAEVRAEVLVVSEFTLYGDLRRGKRPSFDAAAPPAKARELYEYFVERIRAAGLPCQTGRFQETMTVELANDGPVTILLDSRKIF